MCLQYFSSLALFISLDFSGFMLLFICIQMEQILTSKQCRKELLNWPSTPPPFTPKHIGNLCQLTMAWIFVKPQLPLTYQNISTNGLNSNNQGHKQAIPQFCSIFRLYGNTIGYIVTFQPPYFCISVSRTKCKSSICSVLCFKLMKSSRFGQLNKTIMTNN